MPKFLYHTVVIKAVLGLLSSRNFITLISHRELEWCDYQAVRR